MMGNMDPEKVKKVQEVSSRTNAEIRILHDEHEIRLKFVPSTPESLEFVKNFTSQFAETVASQLSTFFGIRGSITDVGQKK